MVLHSLKIWSQFRKHYRLFSQSIYAPITANHLLPASLIDKDLISGLKQVSQTQVFCIMRGLWCHSIKSRTNLIFLHIVFFRYLQIGDFIKSQYIHYPSLPPKTSLDLILEIKPGVKGTISKLYTFIFGLEDSSLESIKKKWENDFECSISEDKWSKILKNIHSSSICARHALIQFKIVHRLHLSKVKLSQIFPEISPTCDRCEQAPACLYHTFWSCSSLLTFWSSIFKLYSKIVGCTIKPCPLLALFGVPSRDLILTNTQLNCIAYSSLLARRLILLNWKSDRPPAFGRWVCDVMYFLKVEKVRYVLQGSTSKFSAIWQPFISYVDQLTIPLNT